MSSLLDIIAAPAKVTVAGVAVDVYGISAKGLAMLMQRFEMFNDLITGKGLDLSTDDLMKIGPEAIAAFIAAGCGAPGDEAHEKVADSLPIGDQVDLVTDIWKATLPGGTKKVIDRLMDLAAAAGLSTTPSPRQSPTSSAEVTAPPANIRRAK